MTSGAQPGLAPSRLRSKPTAVEEFEKQMARPPGRVTVLVDEEAFNWKPGRLYWKKIGAPVGTLDTDALNSPAARRRVTLELG